MSYINTPVCFHIQNPEEVEMAEDSDELTQSSDTATDDIDSPTSGYRHASLLIQKLDSATLGMDSDIQLIQMLIYVMIFNLVS